MAGIMDFLFGQKEKMQQLPTMDPQQMSLLHQMLGGMGGATGSGMNYLSNMLSGSPEAMQAFEAPYMRQFREQTVPSLAERFSSMGSGSQGSSAFGQQLGQQAAGLSENLAALRGNLQQNALSQLMQMMGMGLGARSFENIYRPATSGFIGAMAPGIGQGIGMGLTGGMEGMGSLMNLFKAPQLASGMMQQQGHAPQWAG